MESNQITGRYMYSFVDAAISLAGGGPGRKTNNDFRINTIGQPDNIPLTYAKILLDSKCLHNRFEIMSWDSGSWAAIVDWGGSNNRFICPPPGNYSISPSDVLIPQ